MSTRYLPLIASVLLLAGCNTAHGSGTPNPNQTAIDDGRIVADRECSACHATDRAGPSPRRDAPVFRRILSRYHADTLEVELVQGITLGHPDMPQFQLNPKAVDDLIAYLKWLNQQ